MSRVYERLPLDERHICSLTIPLKQDVVDRITERARRQGVSKTALARQYLLDSLERDEQTKTTAAA